MGNAVSEAGGKQDVKTQENSTENARANSVSKEPGSQDNVKPSPCCANNGCLKVVFVILAIIIILVAIALIVVAVSTAIATKLYNSEQSGRLLAMIILAVSAAATLSVAIYAAIAVFRKKVKPLHAATVAMVILAIIQAVIAGVSVRVTQQDELSLSRSLIESFRMSKDDNPRHMKIWASTQSDLLCCGVYSPEDYRRPGMPHYFPPDVPISCCPSFDPDRSEIVQERAKDVCKARGEFYKIGCKSHVLQVFKETSSWVYGVTIFLIVVQIVAVIVSSVLSRKCEKKTEESNLEEGTEEKTKSVK